MHQVKVRLENLSPCLAFSPYYTITIPRDPTYGTVTATKSLTSGRHRRRPNRSKATRPDQAWWYFARIFTHIPSSNDKIPGFQTNLAALQTTQVCGKAAANEDEPEVEEVQSSSFQPTWRHIWRFHEKPAVSVSNGA